MANDGSDRGGLPARPPPVIRHPSSGLPGFLFDTGTREAAYGPVRSRPSPSAFFPPSTPAGGTAAKSNGAAGENQPASGSRTGEQSNITVRVQVVNVPVSVLDRRGHLVIDLAQKDFELYEDGKPYRSE